MKASICSQFGYCPMVWMFHSRKMNNRINSLHERATIHQRNLQLLATEIFKTKNELNPKIQKLRKNYSHLKTWTTIFEIMRL